MAKKQIIDMKKIEEKAFATLMDALGGNGGDEGMKKAGIAIKTLNLLTRREQLVLSRERMRFSMLRMFAEPKDMRKYVTSTQPEIKKLVAG